MISTYMTRSFLRLPMLSALSPTLPSTFYVTCNLRKSSLSLSRSLVYSSPLPPLDIPNVDFYNFVKEHYLQRPESRIFINGVTLESWTASRVIKSAERLASILSKLGFRQGDCFIIFASNCPEYAVVCLAVLSVGGVVSPANSSFVNWQLENQIKTADAKFLACTNNLLSIAEEVFHKTNLRNIIVMDGDKASKFLSLKAIMRDDVQVAHKLFHNFPLKFDFDEKAAFLVYSSGTTGLPKAVVLTHKNIIASQLQMTHEIFKSANKDECIMGLLPFYHVYGLFEVLFNLTLHHVCVVTLPAFKPASFLSAIQLHRITVMHLVPTLVIFLAKNPLVDDYDVSSIRTIFCGAAPLSADEESMFKQRCNIIDHRQGYGLTETSSMVTAMSSCLRMQLPGSSGILVQNTEARIVNPETGRDANEEEQGEILVRGPQIMKGYLNNTRASEESFVEGWFQTGDIGRFSSEGQLYITGRLKEMIKYKGHQIAPVELESLLLTHPDVVDAAVVGVNASEDVGELPKAFIVLRDGVKNVDEAHVQEFMNQRIMSHMRLRGGVQFLDKIPRSSSGKILRGNLSEKKNIFSNKGIG